MKSIIIKESQLQLISEAMDDSFSFEELSNIRSFAGRVRYCKEHLGYHIGFGSSRIVFQIDDEKCLKLARNRKGLAQNEAEYDKYAERYGVTPILYNSAEDNSWIVTEYVLPARSKDFKKCLGIDFNTFRHFVIYCYNCYARNGKAIHTDMKEWYFEELVENSEWLDDLYHYMLDYQVPCGDLLRMSNLGMVMRDGQAQIVILDSGLTDRIYDEYYRR